MDGSSDLSYQAPPQVLSISSFEYNGPWKIITFKLEKEDSFATESVVPAKMVS